MLFLQRGKRTKPKDRQAGVEMQAASSVCLRTNQNAYADLKYSQVDGVDMGKGTGDTVSCG